MEVPFCSHAFTHCMNLEINALVAFVLMQQRQSCDDEQDTLVCISIELFSCSAYCGLCDSLSGAPAKEAPEQALSHGSYDAPLSKLTLLFVYTLSGEQLTIEFTFKKGEKLFTVDEYSCRRRKRFVMDALKLTFFVASFRFSAVSCRCCLIAL